MYVRDAKNREEVWLLDRIEEMGLDDTAFRSRDYVVAIDEETNAKAGFGRIRIHSADASSTGEDASSTESDGADDDATDVCELTSIGVVEHWRGQGVGAHVVERLVEYATDQGFEEVYALTSEGSYLAQFGFRSIGTDDLPAPLVERLAAKREATDPDAKPLRLDVEDFELPDRFREAFKLASERDDEGGDDATPEEFGIDPETATYKYDTGR